VNTRKEKEKREKEEEKNLSEPQVS